MLKWFTKRAYKSIVEMMRAIYREIEELQPMDTPTVKWVKTRNGMEAHVQEIPSSSNRAAAESESEQSQSRGHFYLSTRIDDDGVPQLVMFNGQSRKPPADSDPSLLSLEYVGAYQGSVSRQVLNYEIPTWMPVSSNWPDGRYYIYLAALFKETPVIIHSNSLLTGNDAVDYFLIGRADKTGNLYTITQDYVGNSMHQVSYSYANAFKLLQWVEVVINENGDNTINVSESLWRVLDGSDVTHSDAGIAFINRQPYAVPADVFDLPGAVFPVYFYMRFTAPIRHLPVEVPASASIVVSSTLMESTDDYLYYLIGEARQAQGGAVMALQAHLTGNIAIDWYGACLGLLEEKSHA